MGVLGYIIIALLIVVIILLIVLISKSKGKDDGQFLQFRREIKADTEESSSALRREISENITGMYKNLGDMVGGNIERSGKGQSEQIKQMSEQLLIRQQSLEKSTAERIAAVEKTIRESLDMLISENRRKLDQMRETVDEKLSKTLNDRISQSFKQVSDQLTEVYKGLGEMQNLAAGVGDLKKVLSNVKTRGILGEIQLGSILSEILSTEQYEENLKIKNEFVEFAVKMPGGGERPVYLPIDAKFPGDRYVKLIDAYDTADKNLIEAAKKEIATEIRKMAKDISTKYIDPPNTTDFAIMFLPTEGLYAEVIRMGLVEILQRDFKINIAGPTTMAALLNSLQMGFKTLAIEKRSSEVWDTLAKVKKEFGNFEGLLQKVRKNISTAGDDIDKLLTTRTNVMLRNLRNVATLEEESSIAAIDENSSDID